MILSRRIIMLKGLPASGKTTWAKQQPGHKRVNKDDLRAMLDCSEHSKENEQFVLKVRNFIVEEAMRCNLPVIVDDTNIMPYHEETLREIAKKHNAPFEVKIFDVPIEVCIERDSKREHPVGAKVIQEMASKHMIVERYLDEEGRAECVICDIDGTIAKMVDRGPYDWQKVGNDHPVQKVIDVVLKASDRRDLIFLSGRDGSCEQITQAWLQQHIMRPFKLYMRNADDNRKDVIIKKELFNEHVAGRYNVACVFDDRDQVVKLWRDMGLQCFQVNYGNF